MKRLWQLLGIIAFWLAWPGVYVYLRNSRRTRVLYMYEGKILVVKGWFSSGKWFLPGGGLHRGESPAQGACRELREETGLVLKPSQLEVLWKGQLKINGIPSKYHFFVTENSVQPSVKRRQIEITQTALINPKSLTTQNANTDVTHALEVWSKAQNQVQ